MQFLSDHKIVVGIAAFLVIVILIGLSNFVYVRFSGSNVPVPDIPRAPITIGTGPEMKYLILGDSTSVSQGSDYDEGYVAGSAEMLSEDYKVTYQNFGVSGAKLNDVLDDQLPRSEGFVPDITLVAVAANNVTHLTQLSSIENDTNQIIDTLLSRNPSMKIILTGSASMGDVKRLGYPLRWVAGLRTRQINEVMLNVANEKQVTFAYVARETGPQFRDNQDTYFAADNFHPNSAGYAVWTPVIIDAINQSLAQ